MHLTSAKKSRKRKPKLVQSEQVEKKIVTILRDNIQGDNPVNGTCVDNMKQENDLGVLIDDKLKPSAQARQPPKQTWFWVT